MDTHTFIEKLSNVLFFLLSMYFLLYVLTVITWDGIGEEIKENRDAKLNFCKEKGYNYASDIKRCDRWGCSSLQIECAKSKSFFIYNDTKVFYAYSFYECIEWDKWGDCTERNNLICSHGVQSSNNIDWTCSK